MPQTIFVPRVDAILTAASESIGFFLLLSFTVIFYCYLLLLSFTVIVFGFSLQVMRTRQDGAMVKQDLFETTKYYQGQP